MRRNKPVLMLLLAFLFLMMFSAAASVSSSSSSASLDQIINIREAEAQTLTTCGLSTNKFPCGFHGDCLNGVCKCHRAPVVGFWTGALCTECLRGFAGPSCTLECAGGAWSRCSNHGICSEGTSGDAMCTCFDDEFFGFWDGPACDRCKPFVFGAACTVRCPGVAEGAEPCYARGSCDAASGNCTCDPGWDPAVGCSDCNISSAGPECGERCKGFVTESGLPCSGHGACFFGVTGNGTCQCDAFYGTADCSKSCPNQCSGHGVCNDGIAGDAKCACVGNFAPPDCRTCRSNVTGANCTVLCPTDGAGVVCSGRGRCESFFDNVTTTFAWASRCVCDLGYTGPSCEAACPGSPPCSGHGSCSGAVSSPACSCFANASHGFWTGSSCDRCAETYNNSATCTAECPTDAYGSVCSGHGWCAEGKCYCDRSATLDYCSSNCNVSSPPTPQIQGVPCALCACELCVVQGTWGPQCNSICPGNLKCSGHGYCDQGVNGTGVCQCTSGYTGESCDLLCPMLNVLGSPAVPCGGIGRGRCVARSRVDPFQGTIYYSACECLPGYGGSACDSACPRYDGDLCGGHGTCNSATAQCICDAGWTGSSCSIVCGCNSDHGKCDAAKCESVIGNSAATCYECVCNGNFTGLCDACAPGYQGELCDAPCVNGTTTGRACVCNSYFSSASCSVPCPGLLLSSSSSSQQICTGHGTCDWGATRPGTCLCNVNWYGKSCETLCTVGDCQTAGFKNPQCNATTGQCECMDDGLSKFVGAQCDRCADGFWGPRCAETCQCNEHGTCSTDTGECTCFASATSGFYGGATCTQCADGYIGDNCERRNIAFTSVQRTVSTVTLRNVTGRSRPFIWPVSSTTNSLIMAGNPVVGIRSLPAGDVEEYGNLPNSSDGCGAEVAVAWSDGNELFAVLQPCRGAIRLYTAPASMSSSSSSGGGGGGGGGSSTTTGGGAVSSSPWTPKNTWKLDLINSSVVISHAVAKLVGSGANIGFVAVLLVAEPRYVESGGSTTSGGSSSSSANSSSSSSFSSFHTSAAYWPGGTLYRLNIDTIKNDGLNKFMSKDLDPTLEVSDIDDFYHSSTIISTELIAIAGRTPGLGWDIHVYEVGNSNLRPYLTSTSESESASIRKKVRCFPKTIVPQDYCPECEDAVRIRFARQLSMIVAIRTAGEPFVIWIMPEPALVDKQMVWAAKDSVSPCERAEYDASLQQLISQTTGRNFLLDTFAIDLARTLVPNAIVTAMATDEFGFVAYVALQPRVGDSPGVLTKFHMQAGKFSVLGSHELGFVVSGGKAIAEVIEVLFVDPRQRLLFALVANTPQVKLLSYLAYEVHNLEPDLVDTRGGTNVTVHGLGFSAQSGFTPMCSFGGGASTLAPATVFTSQKIFCFAPALANSSAAGACSGQPVEVSMYSNSWLTGNGFTIQRVQAARIEGSVVPDRGPLTGLNNISVTGVGFQPSEFSKCKFYSNNTLATEVLYSKFHYVSPTKALCDQPPAKSASFDSSFIDVSLDGQLYSDNAPALYQIVGQARNVSSPPQVTIVAVGQPDPKGNATSIQQFVISATIVDEQKHRLEALDAPTVRTVCLSTVASSSCSDAEFSWRSPGDPYPPVPCRNNTFEVQGGVPLAPECLTMTNGRSDFQIHVADARSGVFLLQFQIIGFGFDAWRTHTALAIQEGAAYALALSNKRAIEARPLFVQGNALSPAPEIAVVDRLGNLLPKLDRLDQNFIITAQAYYILDSDPGHEIRTNRYALSRQDAGRIRFAQIFLTAYIHGANHFINFTSDFPVLRGTVSPPLRTEPCADGNSSFKLPNSSSCLPCPPEGAVCDGSELIRVLPGYWNGTTVGDIFKCPGGKFVCLGSDAAAPCAEGYEGPLCANCIKGWGKAGATSCAPCPDPGLAAFFLVLGGVILIVALFVWSFIILRQPEVTDLSIILRTVVNHLQAAGNLGDFSSEMSPLIRKFLQSQDTASSPSFNGIASLDCVIRSSGQDYEALFYGYMSLPLLSFLMAILMYGFVKVAKFAPVITPKLREEILEDIRNFPEAPSAIFLERYPFYLVAITTLSVCLFTIYQTLIAQSTAVLTCTELVITLANSTQTVKQQFLDVDMNILCDKAGGHKLRTPAYIFAIVYGFGVPGVFYFGYKFFFRRVGNLEIMKLMFMFLTGGYKDNLWYWQAIIMIRKMFLTVVVAFMAETGQLQSYAGMWVMATALLLQLYFSPNEKHDHNQVEAISLAVIVGTLNLGWLYPELNDTGRLLLTIALMLITIGMLVIFAIYMFEPLRQTILEVRDVVLEGVAEISAKIAAGEEQKKRGVRFEDEQETTFELEEVIPTLDETRGRAQKHTTQVLVREDENKKPRFDELEELDRWTDDDVTKFIEQKKAEKIAKLEEML